MTDKTPTGQRLAHLAHKRSSEGHGVGPIPGLLTAVHETEAPSDEATPAKAAGSVGSPSNAEQVHTGDDLDLDISATGEEEVGHLDKQPTMADLHGMPGIDTAPSPQRTRS